MKTTTIESLKKAAAIFWIIFTGIYAIICIGSAIYAFVTCFDEIKENTKKLVSKLYDRIKAAANWISHKTKSATATVSSGKKTFGCNYSEEEFEDMFADDFEELTVDELEARYASK
jgi:hypothetical protein